MRWASALLLTGSVFLVILKIRAKMEECTKNQARSVFEIKSTTNDVQGE